MYISKLSFYFTSFVAIQLFLLFFLEVTRKVATLHVQHILLILLYLILLTLLSQNSIYAILEVNNIFWIGKKTPVRSSKNLFRVLLFDSVHPQWETIVNIWSATGWILLAPDLRTVLQLWEIYVHTVSPGGFFICARSLSR